MWNIDKFNMSRMSFLLLLLLTGPGVFFLARVLDSIHSGPAPADDPNLLAETKSPFNFFQAIPTPYFPELPSCPAGPLSAALPTDVIVHKNLQLPSSQLKKARVRIKSALKQLYQDRSFFCFPSSGDPMPLNIFLAKQDDPEHFGRFYPLVNQIEIYYARFYREGHYLSALRNEFYSFEIIAANVARGMLRTHPNIALQFINDDGDIDETQHAEFKKTLEEFEKNVALYRRIIYSPKNLNAVETDKFLALEKHIDEYTPQQIEYPPGTMEETLSELRKNGLLTSPDAEGCSSSTDRLLERGGIPFSIKKMKQSGVYLSQHSRQFNGDKFSKMEALVSDLQLMIRSIKDHELYQAHDPYMKQHELGSFIASLPPRLMQIFAPGFRTYMQNFYAKAQYEYKEDWEAHLKGLTFI